MVLGITYDVLNLDNIRVLSQFDQWLDFLPCECNYFFNFFNLSNVTWNADDL
jgi:hypothetical protein